MKNLLKSTSALGVGVLAAGTVALTAGNASAAEKMKIGISGDMKFVVAYANQDSKYEDAVGHYGTINAVNDSEIHFSGSTTLDNGITASVMVELETDQSFANTGSVLDETYLKLTGGFGDLRMGSTKAATDTMANFGPVSGPIDHFDNSLEIYVPNPTGTATPDTDIGASDAMKIAYFTPVIEGFQLGTSYTPSESNTDNVPLTGGNSAAAGTADQYQADVAISFERKLGEVDVAADGSYWVKGGTTDQEGYRFGGKFGFSGFTVGGSYASIDNTIGGITATTAVSDYTAYDAGIGYATGAVKMSFAYNHTDSPRASGTAGSDTASLYVLGAGYNLGPGIDLLGSLFRADYGDETTTASLNNDAWGGIAAIKVSF